MNIYGPDPINIDGVSGDRYWFEEPSHVTGNPYVDKHLSGFPVAIFRPSDRHPSQTPLVIGLQGMGAPYGWNGFIVPTLTQMGIAVALFDTPFAGERSLSRRFTGLINDEIIPLAEFNVKIDTQVLSQIFQRVAIDISQIRDFCGDRYGLTDSRLALFGVSMGVLLAGYAFTSAGMGERLLGAIGHANLQTFARTWGRFFLPELAASPVGSLIEAIAPKFKSIAPIQQILPSIKLLQTVYHLKYPDQYALASNPITYANQVSPHRRVRFLVGVKDPIVSVKDAHNCAKLFPDAEVYPVPGLGHGTSSQGISFVEHVRYFLTTQLGDWQG